MVEDNNSAWMQELELALQEEKQGESITEPGPIDLEDDSVSPNNAHQSIAETFRPEVWKKYLDISGKENRVIFSDIYDLPEQNELRNDCKQIVEKLGNDDEDKVSVLSDLESILTQFRKTRSPSRPYTTDNGWIELLFPVVALKLPKQETYNLFEAIHRRYIVRHNDVFHTLTLLILYHDPALSNFLVTKKITSTHVFTKTWFQSLFAAQCNLQVVYAIWDLYFQQEDPFFIFFLALVIIVNARDQIFALKDEPKDKIIEALSLLPCGLERDDISDFCSLAQYYDYKTPRSFKTELKSCLFETEASKLLNTNSILDKSFISQALCLPVSAEELLQYTRHSLDYREDSVRFFLIDCRPALQYNNGHLPTAFHLDSNLMLQEPTAFATAVQGLLSCQRAAIKQGSQAGGEHVCFLGCGQLEEDQYTHMVVSSFLQRQIQFISLVKGGYQSVHSCLEECNSLDDGLVDHNPAECLVCLGSSPSRGSETTPSPSVTTPSSPFARSHSSSDLFGKIGAAMKSKSAEVKEKLIEIISSPSSANANNSPSFKSNSTVNRRSIGGGSSKRRYRNVAPVFSIDDEHEPQTETSRDSEPDDETIDSVQAWLDKPEVIATFECQQINMQGYLCDSILLVTDTNLIVLRELPDRGRGQVELMVNRRLATIGRITTKKKHPEFITFQYGTPNCADPSDMDRFLIPKAKEATELLSHLILRCVEEEQRQKQETGNSSETIRTNESHKSNNSESNKSNESDKSNNTETNKSNESDKSNNTDTNKSNESDKSNNSDTNKSNESDKSNNSEASETSKAS